MTEIAPVRPQVLRADEGLALWSLGSLVTVKATGAHTHGRVTVVEFLNPPGFSPPLHRHLVEDEMFLVLEGAATFSCDGEDLPAGVGDFVVLPAGLAHTFTVSADGPLRTLQITTPAGFEEFAGAVGREAAERRLPDPDPGSGPDPAAMAHVADLFGVEILGPPGAREA